MTRASYPGPVSPTSSPRRHRRSSAVDLRYSDDEACGEGTLPAPADLETLTRINTRTNSRTIQNMEMTWPDDEETGLAQRVRSYSSSRRSSSVLISPSDVTRRRLSSTASLVDILSLPPPTETLAPHPLIPGLKPKPKAHSLPTLSDPLPPVPEKSPRRASFNNYSTNSIFPEIKKQAAARLFEKGLVVNKDLDQWSKLWDQAFDKHIEERAKFSSRTKHKSSKTQHHKERHQSLVQLHATRVSDIIDAEAQRRCSEVPVSGAVVATAAVAAVVPEVARRISLQRRERLEYQVQHKCGDGSGAGRPGMSPVQVHGANTWGLPSLPVTEGEHQELEDLERRRLVRTVEAVEEAKEEEREEEKGEVGQGNDIVQMENATASVLLGESERGTAERRRSWRERWVRGRAGSSGVVPLASATAAAGPGPTAAHSTADLKLMGYI